MREGDLSDDATCYDALLVGRMRDLTRIVARIPLIGARLAPRVVAASYCELRRNGWNCSLHVGGGPNAAGARLEVNGACVLDVGEAGTDLRCVGRNGGDLESVPPRRPACDDVLIARVQSTDDVGADLAKLLDQLGGLSSIVRPGARVLLKANFNSYHDPPASTGLDLLTAAVGELEEAGAGVIALGECSAIALGRTREVLRQAGVTKWADAHKVEVRCFDEEPWQRCEVPGRRFHEIVVPACLQEFDHIIYLLCAKTHHQAGVSLGLKMTIGFMHPAQRLELHRDHLTERIADASLAVRPDLAVLDARSCFVTGGPAEGTVASPGVMLASRNLEALEEQGLDLLEAHGAVGVETGREQLRGAQTIGAQIPRR